MRRQAWMLLVLAMYLSIARPDFILASESRDGFLSPLRVSRDSSEIFFGVDVSVLAPPDTRADSLRFYHPIDDLELSQFFATFAALILDDISSAAVVATEMERVRAFLSIHLPVSVIPLQDVADDGSVLIPICSPQSSDLCVEPDQDYIYELGTIDDSTQLPVSYNTNFTLTTPNFDPQSLEVDQGEALDSPITVRFAPPVNITLETGNELLGFLIEVAYKDLGNAASLQTFAFRDQPLPVVVRSYSVGPTSTNVTIPRCADGSQQGSAPLCLAAYTTYSISVTAIGRWFNGMSVAVIATPIGPPVHPVRDLAEQLPKESTRLRLTFKEPKPSTGPVVGYFLHIVCANGFVRDLTYLQNDTDRHYSNLLVITGEVAIVAEITDLLPFTSFTIHIAAVTDSGVGPFQEAPLVLSTLEDTCAQLSQPTLRYDLQSKRVVVSWLPQRFPRGVTRGFQVLANQSTILYNVAQNDTFQASVYAEYARSTSFRVRCWTSVGFGPWSDAALLPANTVIDTDDSGSSSALSPQATIAVVVIPIVAVILVILIVMHVRRQRQPASPFMFFLPGRDKWDIPRASIERIDLLSTGAYDNVFLARLRDSQSLHNTVAVKVCHRDILDHDKRAFLLEAEYLKQFAADNHPNIIKIVGTCLLEEPLTIVMEFMENSDMSSFLIGNQDMSVPMQLNFARDIASGMQYLCSRNVVHRNLSSVNCLVSRSFVVKLSDFKQARDLRQVQYYRQTFESVLPNRYSDPVTIETNRFSQSTDVWSFGVVMWEIFAKGRLPYEDWCIDEMLDQLRRGYRLSPPVDCPEIVGQLIVSCWYASRPSFWQLDEYLSSWAAAPELLDTFTLPSSALTSPPVNVMHSNMSPSMQRSENPYTAARALTSNTARINDSHVLPKTAMHNVSSDYRAIASIQRHVPDLNPLPSPSPSPSRTSLVPPLPFVTSSYHTVRSPLRESSNTSASQSPSRTPASSVVRLASDGANHTESAEAVRMPPRLANLDPDIIASGPSITSPVSASHLGYHRITLSVVPVATSPAATSPPHRLSFPSAHNGTAFTPRSLTGFSLDSNQSSSSDRNHYERVVVRRIDDLHNPDRDRE